MLQGKTVMMRVIVHHNSTPIKTYQFSTESVTIGRLATNTIPINSMGVSRHHLKIERETSTGKMFAEDLSSLNGSFINNQKISRMAFDSGSEIVLGKYSLTVEFTDEEPEIVVSHAIPELEVQSTASINIIEQTPATLLMDATATSEHAASLILDEINLMNDTPDPVPPIEELSLPILQEVPVTKEHVVIHEQPVAPKLTELQEHSDLEVVTTSDDLELMDDNSHAISFAEPLQSSQQSNIVEQPPVVDDTPAASNFVFTSTAQTKKITIDAEEIDSSSINAVLIDLNRQVIYKINKTRMTFGSGKNADIFVESGVFSSDNLATLTVEDSNFLLTKGNGKLKVNEKKAPSYLLSHKDKIKIDNSEFSFMIKDNG